MNTVFLILSKLLLLSLVLQLARGQDCTDDPTFTFKLSPESDKEPKYCDWLNQDGAYRTSAERIAEFCVRGDVKGACSSTCGFCNCRDKFHYKFVNHRENERFCSWINATRVDGTPADWCYTEDSTGAQFPTEIGNNCIFSCEFCQEEAETTTAAPVPTPSPSLVPTASFCEDDPTFMMTIGASSDSNNILSTGCNYLSGISDVEKAELCSKGNIMGRCSKTCSFCTCRDDSTFTFLHRYKDKNCSWITSKAEKMQRRREKYCYTDDSFLESSDIGDECPFSCGFCQDYEAFPSPTPSTSPTKLHSSSPSSNPSSFPSSTPSVSSRPSSIPSLSNSPSTTPSSVPSLSSYPSKTPSLTPSISLEPSSLPSQSPSLSSSPSSIPSQSSFPSILPSSVPSVTAYPSDTPSSSPSVSNSPSRLPSQVPSLSFQPSVSLSPSSGPSSIALRIQIEAIYDSLLKTNYEDAYDAALAWFIQSANHPSLKLGDADYLLDRFMLALFYNQNCNSGCSTNLSNWMSTSDHCSWYGVSCNTGYYVTVINLPQSGLSGSLPFLKMDKLEYLTLPENSLTGAIPNFDMGNLEQMILNDNSLDNGIPAFDKLPNLLDMILSNNNFSSIANVLENCPKLVSIALTNNSHNLLVVDGDLCSASQNTPFILDLTGTTSNCP